MYKVKFNDTNTDQLALCKQWWQNFVNKSKEGIDTSQWIKTQYRHLVDTALIEEGIERDPNNERILIFKSEAHFNWFILKWSN